MGKLTSWILAVTLLFSWSWPVDGFDRLPKHRSVGLHAEDAGKIALFILYVVICEYGKKLDKGHKCPVYCDVGHKHIYWENDEDKKSNIPPDDGLSRPDEPKGGEQPESDLRPIASTD